MVKVTVNRPEPVFLPPETYTLELTKDQAIYIHAILGTQNRGLADALGIQVDPAWEIYNPLHTALVDSGLVEEDLWEKNDLVREFFYQKYGK